MTAFLQGDDVLQNETASKEELTSTNSKTSHVLSSPIEMDSIELLVSDLTKVVAFYQQLVGLEVISQSVTEAVLGYEGKAILRLEQSTLPAFSRSSAGLYHLAVLFESRPMLANAVERILQKRPELFEGSADHLVSEAFYFHDPELNGVELYFDRDPAGWQWQNGQVVMDSLYIDPTEYILQYSLEDGSQAKKLGHVHLQVGDIAEARTFYVDILGFSATAGFSSALFVSDGKYHHHIGMNTWHSARAGKRSETLGLKCFSMIIASPEDVVALGNRLSEHSVSFTKVTNGISVHDPWGNEINLFSLTK